MAGAEANMLVSYYMTVILILILLLLFGCQGDIYGTR
jgi:hypothetical protein